MYTSPSDLPLAIVMAITPNLTFTCAPSICIGEFIKFVKDRPYNDKRYSISTNKIRKLGWRPKNTLMLDLFDIIEWYKNNIQLFKNFK